MPCKPSDMGAVSDITAVPNVIILAAEERMSYERRFNMSNLSFLPQHLLFVDSKLKCKLLHYWALEGD